MLGLAVDRITEDETVDAALAGLRAGRGGWICPANLDVLRQVTRAPDIGALVGQADLVVADGMPLLWASRVQGAPLPERVAGSSLIRTLPAAAARHGRSVFLLGGAPGVADDAAATLCEELPELRLAGTYCPPEGFERSDRELATLEEALRAASPDLVFVALGFPKQEQLIVRLRALLPGAWFVSVGASLGFVSGTLARAPRWMQDVGLEWLHRLAHEPRRLARRYLVEGIPFLLRVLARSARRRLAGTEAPA